MPISAPGRSIAERPGNIPITCSVCGNVWLAPKALKGMPARGFTLIEVLVTLLIASVMFGMALLSMHSLDRGLQVEAQRLSQLLSFARDYAQMRGRAVRFEADGSGYRFISRNQGDWALILDEPVLRERVWDKPTQVRLEREALPFSADALPGSAPASNVVEFGRDYVDTPFVLWLAQDNQKLGIASNGLGRFQVQAEATR